MGGMSSNRRESGKWAKGIQPSIRNRFGEDAVQR
jgi:hypothetical protein